MTEEAPNNAPEPTAEATQAPANEPAATTEQAQGAPAQPAETVQEPAKQPYFSDDQLAEMQKFIENNGGYDQAWKKMKAGISNPQPKPAEQQPVEAPKVEAQPAQPAKPQAGHMTRDEFFAVQYFDSLSKDPKYANIADQIRNGEALKEMAKFGINAINGDDINDAQVRQFLDMYAKASTPVQTEAPVTNTPTVDYVEVKEINSMKDVDEIMRQNITLKAQGKPLHPQTEEAKKFAKEYFKK